MPCAPVQVSVGSESLGEVRDCALLSSRRVACWNESHTPTLIEDVHDVAQVSGHCMLHVDGAVRCQGQLDPVSPEGKSCSEISSYGHVCMLTDTGELWCTQGCRGGMEDGCVTPGRVSDLADATAVLAGPGPWGGRGGLHGCAVRAGGEVQCWYSHLVDDEGGWVARYFFEPFEMQGLSGAIDLDLGSSESYLHSVCAVLASGEVICDSYPSDDTLTPRNDVPTSDRVTLGRGYACVRTFASEVWCWGDNSVGQLGQGHTDPVGGAVRVAGLDRIVELDATAPITGIACCFEGQDPPPDTRRACALRDNGEVWCWGGLYTSSPLRVPLPGGR